MLKWNIEMFGGNNHFFEKTNIDNETNWTKGDDRNMP